MSEENVEIVRNLIDAWNEHDEGLSASYLADDIEWAPAGPAAVDRVVYRGREECARGLLQSGRPGTSFASRRRRSAT